VPTLSDDRNLLVPIARSPRLIVASGVLALVAAVAALAGLSACSTSSAGASNQQTRYVAVGNGVLTTYAAGHRKLAPHVAGADLAGKPLDLAQFAGKVVVLNFWASWCPPCRSEAAALQQLSTDTKAAGVQFVGVDIRENGPSDGVQFVAAHNIDYPSFADQSARIALAFRNTGIPPETPPSTLVIDRQGRIAARGLGEMTYSGLAPVVQAVAKESS
jgi:thiol-disulfide isomerase/thioredoxin